MRHQTISFIKSAIRILGYACLAWSSPVLALAAVFLVTSELVGIVEEFGHE